MEQVMFHVKYEDIKNQTVTDAMKEIKSASKHPREIDLETLGRTAAGQTGVYLYFNPQDKTNEYFYIGVGKLLIQRAIIDQLYGYLWKKIDNIYQLKVTFVVFGEWEGGSDPMAGKERRVQAEKLEQLFIATLQPTVNVKKGSQEAHQQFLETKNIIEYMESNN